MHKMILGSYITIKQTLIITLNRNTQGDAKKNKTKPKTKACLLIFFDVMLNSSDIFTIHAKCLSKSFAFLSSHRKSNIFVISLHLTTMLACFWLKWVEIKTHKMHLYTKLQKDFKKKIKHDHKTTINIGWSCIWVEVPHFIWYSGFATPLKTNKGMFCYFYLNAWPCI